MKVPLDVKKIILQLSKLALRARRLNIKLFSQLDDLGVDCTSDDFVACFGYVEGDCCPEVFLSFLENL